jgi:hypothetical protein
LDTTPDDTSPEDIDTGFDWVTLDSHVSTAVREIEAALEEALAATRDLNQWVERLHTLSAFLRQVESGLAEVRQQLKGPPQARRIAPARAAMPEAGPAEVTEAWPLEPNVPEVGEEPLLTPPEPQEAEEAESRAEPAEAAVAEAEEAPEPAKEEPSEGAPSVAGVGDTIRLQIESTEANIDVVILERALRETPGVADVDLLDYAGKRARLQVTFGEGERPEEVADPERLAANVQERLAKLIWNDSLSVSTTD